MNIGNYQLLEPIGSSNPYYYIIGYGVSQEEITSQIIFNPMSGESNKYLHSILSSLGIANEARFNKIVKFNYVTWNMNDQQREISQIQLENDILSSNPKVIIALGSKVAEFLLGNRFVSLSNQAGRNIKCKIKDKEFPLVITYSPEYLVKDQNQEDEDEGEDTQVVMSKQKFINDILYSCKIANGEISDLSAKNLVAAKNYSEFLEYYEKYLKDNPLIAFDIETNAQPVHSDSFRIIGFSLSGDIMNGVYVVKESLDYSMTESDWEKIVELTKRMIFDNSKIIVHNCMYEVPSTLNNWNYRLKNFDDTLVMSRVLLGGKTGAGLKEQCAINLGYPEWEEDLTTYRNCMDYFRSIMKPTPGGKTRWYYDYLKDHGYSLEDMKKELVDYTNDLLNKYDSQYNNKDISKKEYDEFCRKLRDSKENTAIIKINSISAVVRDYYPEDDEFEYIMHLIGKELVYLVESSNYGFLPYSSVPYKLLSLYGAVDAVGTRELYEALSSRLTKESNSEVDLWRGYEIMLAQFRVAISMEMNGIFWDDSIAEDEYQWFNSKAIESMRNMLLSGYLDEKIYKNCRSDWVRYLIENNPEELKELIGEEFYLTEKGIKKSSGGREILFRNIPNLINEQYWEENREFLLNYIKKILIFDNTYYKWYSDYKYIYNPGSPKQEDFLTSILVTDDVRIANILSQFKLLLGDKQYNWENFDANDRQPFELIKSIDEHNAEIEAYNLTSEGQKSPRKLISKQEIFNKFKDLISEMRFNSKDLNQRLIDSLSYRMPDAREGSLLFLYDLFALIGYDIESDRSEWSKEFAFLVDYRSFKKCVKMMTTYITGSRIGRGAVAEVLRSDIDSNKELPIRHSWYSGNKSINSEYILQTNLQVCSAETYRWRSGAHTIPGDATIKNIYRSRYKGGVIFAPDYSQAEIRAIAGLSNCEPMLEAFRGGADIHKFNASKIWGIPESEVTSAQRRYAKAFSFALLYGSSIQSVAEEYFHNDVNQAQKVFDDFFKAFPEIDNFINKMHDIMYKTGKVPVSKTGMMISVSPADFKGDAHKAERAAQNYPVQSCSSNMAGYVLSKANDYLLENNMKSKTVLFIHDSLEFDVHPDDFLTFADYLIKSMNDIPMNEFGVPMKIDLELGVSMGQLVTMSNLKLSDDKRSGEFDIEGSMEDFDLLINNWKKVYSVVEWEDLEEPKTIYVPKGNLFIRKVAISRKLGRNQSIINRKVKICY